MLVLVVNAGSSSLKSQLIETDGKVVSMKCLAEKVGTDEAYMNISFAPDFEKQRYEGHASLVGVPWQDERGHRHTYKVNNDHTALLGRWLLKRHPFMRVERRRSRFDGEGDAA